MMQDIDKKLYEKIKVVEEWKKSSDTVSCDAVIALLKSCMTTENHEGLKLDVETDWLDWHGGKTEALSWDKEEQYSISEFIALLEEAKKRWGDKKIFFHDLNNNCIGGFSTVYLKHGLGKIEGYEDEYDEDEICIYG